MKISPAQIRGTIQSPPSHIMAWLLYGPDEGKARHYAKQIAQNFLQGPLDPFSYIQLSGSDFKNNPNALLDDLFEVAMFSQRRCFRVFDITDSFSSLMKNILEHPQASTLLGDNLIVVEAKELRPNSSLRKLFEGAKNAAAIACYTDEAKDIAQLTQSILHEHHLTIEREAMDYLLSHLGGDHSLSRGEIEKLCLYKGEGCISFDDVHQLLKDTQQSNIQNVLMATASGKVQDIEQNIQRLWSDSVAPIALLRSMMRHFLKLLELREMINQGLTADQAVQQLRPPVFFKIKPAFIQQGNIWNIPRITQALNILTQAEKECKLSANLSASLTHYALIRIAGAAQKAIKQGRR